MKNNRSKNAAWAALALAGTLAMSSCGVSQDQASSASGAATSTSACTGTNESSGPAPSKLTLALVPSGDAKKLVDTVKPLEEALSSRLGIPVTGVITADYQAAVEAIGANQAQIGMLPSLQMSQACDKYGAIPALQTVRKEKSSYAAQMFTNNPDKYCTDKPAEGPNGMLYCNGTASGNGPAGLDAVKKIKGSTVAMLSSASPAGYIFPVAAMKTADIALEDISAIKVTANDASVLAVYKGDAEVGFSYWDAREVVASDTPDIGSKVVVFALTDEVPNDGMSISSKLSSEWQQKISDAMLDFAGTTEGVKALKAIYQITGMAVADPKSLSITQEAAKSIGLG
ncbi:MULTISPECIES: phosphate/phosphite/phosphonate ABC transporter substrate-binding protein [Arthrobacter]|uniref:phosphate/phosphite/phosphonate ABC transporter substrate-binding protein n=1 Tax=unclassified Arthrobacter TaxID=235627 RepID=UPI0024BBE4C7|nr:phosphate/phosphite/phosphonate ABC transporter substrate-binding protein [Arthrobacter sp. H35-MC1]MDJ0316315.1 phosphate/phosphite/phosphonate ABC transporter substrate-binding protein [Arthrobacter sp. H35-MC1]